MRLHSFRNKTKGFTIIELIIVIVVIGILAAIGIIAYNGVTQSGRDKAILSDIDGVVGEVTRYGTKNNGVYGSAMVWYSGGGANPNIKFTPSSGNVIDVVANTNDFCVRGYNPASNKKTIIDSYSEGSTNDACLLLFASTAAGGTGGGATAWWDYDGGVANEISGGISGNVVGATPAVDRNNNPASAYDFNGTNQYIDYGIDANYNSTEFSVSIWAKSDLATPPHVRNLIGKGNWNEANNWFIGYRNATHVAFAYGLVFNVGPSYSLSSFNATQWHHYVGTASATQQKLYIDGILVDTKNVGHVAITNTYPLQVGRSSYTATFFDGAVDDIRLYDRALSDTTIAGLYNRGPQ